MKTADGEWYGISIDLWKEIATELKLEYEFTETDLRGLIEGVRDGRFDAAIAAISVTPEREQICDFTHPYYNSGLGIAVKPANTSSWMDTITHFLSWDLLRVFGTLIVSLAVVGLLMWLIERKHNPAQFGGTWRSGIGSGFWWSAVTLTTVGYGDKAPVTLAGRLLALLWMFSAIIIVASFTATMTTTMTIARLESAIKGPDDLVNVRVGTVANATSEVFLRNRKVACSSYPALLDGLHDLAGNRIDAMVYDAPMLSYWVHHEALEDITVLPGVFDKQIYSIALPAGSPLRKPINRVILQKVKSEGWQELIRTYLGDQ
jgi:ABC-type amino acid transport substrate-binding protein